MGKVESFAFSPWLRMLNILKGLSALYSSSFENSILFCVPILMGVFVSTLSDVQLVKMSSPSASGLFVPMVVSLCRAAFSCHLPIVGLHYRGPVRKLFPVPTI